MAASAPALRSLSARHAEARRHTDLLFGLLRPGALLERPIPQRHRLVFYLGHLEAFDWNLLGRAALGLEPFHAQFDRLFAFGIDPLDGKLPHEPADHWPGTDAIRAYNGALRRRLDQALQSSAPAEETAWIWNAAIEHRLMHAETLVYQMRCLEPALLAGPPARERPGAAPARRRIEIPPGEVTLGAVRGGGFGWDNEFDAHPQPVAGFEIDAYPVTNADFLEFQQQGGYQEPSLWGPADWQWRCREDRAHPQAWVPAPDGWRCRAVFGEVPLPLSWPVRVSHAEAAAYARWRGASLPSEAQWQRAALGTPAGSERSYPWGEQPPGPARGNFDSRRWDPAPVDAHPGGASAFGVHDLLGNGWEWTSTPFAPFPGFRADAFYAGYSADFFDGRHYVLKGGGPRTASCMLRRSFRNWFQPHYPYADAKFRLVWS